MSFRFVVSGLFAAFFATVTGQSLPDLTGAWVLNPALTQRPQEIGFSDPEWARAAGGGQRGGSGGGRGPRGGGGDSAMGAPPISRESREDSTRRQQLSDEARNPPARLTIIQKEGSVSLADDQGHARTFHPNGNREELTLGTLPLPTTARWDNGSLLVVYDVDNGRQLRYTFTPAANPRRLLVGIRFLERGREGDEVKLTYEPPDARDRALLSGTAAPTAPPPPGSAPLAAQAGVLPSARPPVLPPGSELRGLVTIGTTIDELTAQATACGLDRAKIKTSIARILADAGFRTQPDGNEETYVLASIVTSRLSDGTCVSRYDASLVTDADATLPYLKGTVALQVPLLHEGGMAGGSPALHAAAVMEALTKSVTRFVSQIRAAR